MTSVPIASSVDEHHQGEETTAKRGAVEKVVRNGLAEHGQGVEPLGGRNRDVLCQLVPHQPVATDAADINEREQRNAGQPGKEAAATQAIMGELPEDVQDDDDDECIGCVTVQAAHEPSRVPLVVGDVLDRRIGIRDAGVKEDIQVDAGRCDDPVEIPAERSQPDERVVSLAERVLEYCLALGERACQGAFDQCHNAPIARAAIP
jgi:hypothetical protein